MNTLYMDESSFTTFSHVIGKSLTAYNDDSGVAQDLTLGASSNVKIEGVDSVSMYAKDTGSGIKLYTTSYDGAGDRVDKQILGVQQSTTSNVTVVSATETNALSLQGSDAYNTIKAGDMTVYTSNDTQHISTTAAGGFVFDQSLRTEDSFVAAQHLFGKDIVGYSNTGLTGLGQLAEAGFCIRMNDQLQIEMIKYGKVNIEGGTKPVYKRVGIFGVPEITSNMDSDITGVYDPFADLSLLINPAALAGGWESVMKAFNAANSGVVAYDLFASDITGSTRAITAWGEAFKPTYATVEVVSPTFYPTGGLNNDPYVGFPQYSLFRLPDIISFSLASAEGLSIVMIAKYSSGIGYPASMSLVEPGINGINGGYLGAYNYINGSGTFVTEGYYVADPLVSYVDVAAATTWAAYAYVFKPNTTTPSDMDIEVYKNGALVGKLSTSLGVETGAAAGSWTDAATSSMIRGIFINGFPEYTPTFNTPTSQTELYAETPMDLAGYALYKRALTSAEAIALTTI